MDAEEAAIYDRIHVEAELVTSGYSTISSSKEEEYLSYHLANQSAAQVIAASARRSTKDGAATMVSA